MPQAIRAHYQRAGTALLTMMLAHFDLRQWLATCKNFFLLYQSDFLTNFLESAGEELSKEAGRTSVARLRSLLEIAIRTSSLHRAPHADQLLLTLDSRSFSELHTVRPQATFCTPHARRGCVRSDRETSDRSALSIARMSVHGCMRKMPTEYRLLEPPRCSEPTSCAPPASRGAQSDRSCESARSM